MHLHSCPHHSGIWPSLINFCLCWDRDTTCWRGRGLFSLYSPGLLLLFPFTTASRCLSPMDSNILGDRQSCVPMLTFPFSPGELDFVFLKQNMEKAWHILPSCMALLTAFLSLNPHQRGMAVSQHSPSYLLRVGTLLLDLRRREGVSGRRMLPPPSASTGIYSHFSCTRPC